jgi:hypothetical protein
MGGAARQPHPVTRPPCSVSRGRRRVPSSAMHRLPHPGHALRRTGGPAPRRPGPRSGKATGAGRASHARCWPGIRRRVKPSGIWLAELTRRHNRPQKLLLLHRCRLRCVHLRSVPADASLALTGSKSGRSWSHSSCSRQSRPDIVLPERRSRGEDCQATATPVPELAGFDRGRSSPLEHCGPPVVVATCGRVTVPRRGGDFRRWRGRSLFVNPGGTGGRC